MLRNTTNRTVIWIVGEGTTAEMLLTRVSHKAKAVSAKLKHICRLLKKGKHMLGGGYLE